MLAPPPAFAAAMRWGAAARVTRRALPTLSDMTCVQNASSASARVLRATSESALFTEHIQTAQELHRFGHEPLAFGRFGEIGGGVSVAPAEPLRLGFEAAGGIGAAAVVNEYVAAGREHLAADGEADTLGAGGDEGALAVKFMHGRSEESSIASAIINQLLDMGAEMKPLAPVVALVCTRLCEWWESTQRRHSPSRLSTDRFSPRNSHSQRDRMPDGNRQSTKPATPAPTVAPT